MVWITSPFMQHVNSRSSHRMTNESTSACGDWWGSRDLYLYFEILLCHWYKAKHFKFSIQIAYLLFLASDQTLATKLGVESVMWNFSTIIALLHIFGMNKVGYFIFGKQVDHDKYYPTDDKTPLKVGVVRVKWPNFKLCECSTLYLWYHWSCALEFA